MTTTAAENRVGERDKMEKRRALGRGLASLLPGPRVVVPGVDTGAKAPIGRWLALIEQIGQIEVFAGAKEVVVLAQKDRFRSTARR